MDLIPRITRAQSMDVLSSQATVGRLQGGGPGRRRPAQDVPDADHGGGHDPAGQGVRHRRRRGGSPGDRHRQTARRRRGGLRRAARREGAGPERRRQVRRARSGHRGRRGQAAATPRRWTRTSTAASRRADGQGRGRASDVVITTAAIPGKPSPVLVTADMVAGMQPGSVIVDLAAERGGNCELTRADEIVVEHGVTIFGPDQPPGHRPLPRQPDVRQERRRLPAPPGEGRRDERRPGRPDHPRDAADEGRRGRASHDPQGPRAATRSRPGGRRPEGRTARRPENEHESAQ